ncbi:MAG: tyrosine--tRNA ligase [Spirochaetales bacterium]|nr:tyrosine--tRNA ligase [Spirochaetales bacterium]MCF7937061.1 tyrosine--tRNA ligase [Spirochaetales bacterium]
MDFSSRALKVLAERGFLRQCSDIEALDRLLSEQSVSLYCGFDPTGPSLHVGHLIPLFAMAHMQRAGHRPIALVGGGTARIGDPSGKTEMRKMQSVETITANAERIGEQMTRFLNFSADQAVMRNNADWLADLNYIDFLRDIGRHFSVNRMLSFETYKMRLETGLSFIEFNYQLLQSYDFLVLFQREGARLQIGGDDQWGNIVAGADLIRRIEGGEAYGLTFPLVTRSDGKKMGKTEKGALYLDPEITSPYEFFQYWRNVADADVEKFLFLYTFLPAEEVRRLGALEGSAINTAKETLAFELTRIIHGDEEAGKALKSARSAFGAGGGTGGPAGGMDAIPSLEISETEIAEGIGALDLFARTSLCSSRAEARRLIDQGGARVNDRKITDQSELIDSNEVQEGEILLRAGKKRYFRILVI